MAETSPEASPYPRYVTLDLDDWNKQEVVSQLLREEGNIRWERIVPPGLPAACYFRFET